MFRRRSKIAPARALKLGAARKTAPARKVSGLVSLAVRVATLRAQVAWFATAIATIVALYFVSKIEHPKHARITAETIAKAKQQPTPVLIFDPRMSRDLLIDPGLLDPAHPHSHVAESYGDEALGAIVFPSFALVVALLLSWQRRKRRMLRYGREVQAEIREFDRGGDARATSVQLWLPVEGTTAHKGIVTIRPPDTIGTTEPVIYDPNNPNYAFALADLPGAPRIVDGRLTPTRFTILPFVFPVGALALIALLAFRVVTR